MQKIGKGIFGNRLVKMGAQKAIAAPDNCRDDRSKPRHIELNQTSLFAADRGSRKETRPRDICDFGWFAFNFGTDKDSAKQDALAWQCPALLRARFSRHCWRYAHPLFSS